MQFIRFYNPEGTTSCFMPCHFLLDGGDNEHFRILATSNPAYVKGRKHI
jgi:hypothetical protein